MPIKVSLVIMNKNDLVGAREVIPKIDRSLFHEIFAVDGGSTDGSVEFFRAQGITTYVENKGGRGGAFRFATAQATGDYLVFLSTDGEEDPGDLKEFVRCFEAGADMVIASRLAPGAHHKAMEKIIWLHRMLYLKFYTWLLNLAFGMRLTDCWNGYRGFRRTALASIPTDAKNYLIEAQQTIRFRKAGMKIMEFPTHEGQRIGGQSGNPIFSTGFEHLILLYREKFSKPRAPELT